MGSGSPPEYLVLSEGTVENAAATCRAYCDGGGYPYFGLQHTNECFCGGSYPSMGTATGCVNCGIAGGEGCGGKNAVFRTHSGSTNLKLAYLVFNPSV